MNDTCRRSSAARRALAGLVLIVACLAEARVEAQSAEARSTEAGGAGAPSSDAPEGAPPSTTAVTATPSSDAYRETINAAVAEFAAEHHAEARALFRRAHAMRPNARTLRGIGMCAFELREYAEAVRALSAALIDTRRPLTEEHTAQVQAALERANAFVGRFEVTVPSGALLFVDGASAPTELDADGTLLLTLGTHVIETRRDSTTLGDVRVEVRGGEREPLVLVREAVVTPTPTPTPATDAPDLVPGIALIASGGALLVGGAIVFAIGLADASSVESARANTPWSSLAGAYDRAPVLQGIGATSLGLGIGLAAVGGILLGLEGASSTPDSARSDRPRIRVDAGFGSVSLRGSF